MYRQGVVDDVERFFATSDMNDVCLEARRLVFDVYPQARETLDRGDRIVGYATGPGPMKDLWVGIAPHSKHVNLQLAKGALIEDPAGIIQGTGKRVRHVKLHSVADVQAPQLRAVLERSLALQESTG
jgi:hypothetical protein